MLICVKEFMVNKINNQRKKMIIDLAEGFSTGRWWMAGEPANSGLTRDPMTEMVRLGRELADGETAISPPTRRSRRFFMNSMPAIHHHGQIEVVLELSCLCVKQNRSKNRRWLDFVLVTFCPSLYCSQKYSYGFVLYY